MRTTTVMPAAAAIMINRITRFLQMREVSSWCARSRFMPATRVPQRIPCSPGSAVETGMLTRSSSRPSRVSRETMGTGDSSASWLKRSSSIAPYRDWSVCAITRRSWSTTATNSMSRVERSRSSRRVMSLSRSSMRFEARDSVSSTPRTDRKLRARSSSSSRWLVRSLLMSRPPRASMESMIIPLPRIATFVRRLMGAPGSRHAPGRGSRGRSRRRPRRAGPSR